MTDFPSGFGDGAADWCKDFSDCGEMLGTFRGLGLRSEVLGSGLRGYIRFEDVV